MYSWKERFCRFGLLFFVGFIVCFLWETKLTVSFVPVGQISAERKLLFEHRKAEPSGMPSQAEPGNENVKAEPGNEDVKNRVEQGVRFYQAGRITEAINIWQQSLGEISNDLDRAIVHTNLAVAYRDIGNLASSVEQWERASQIYRDRTSQTTRQSLANLLVEQGQTYSDLGQHQRAIQLLQSALEMAQKNNWQPIQSAALVALGKAYWGEGNYDRALASLEEGLKILRFQDGEAESGLIATALNNLGNVFASRAERYRYQVEVAKIEGDDTEAERLNKLVAQDREAAIAAFEQSAQTAKDVATARLTEVKALLNLNRVLGGDLARITPNRARILSILEKLPDSRDKVYGLINLAMGVNRSQLTVNSQQSAKLLGVAIAIARNISDERSLSFALGSLGQLYEASRQYSEAMNLTGQAQLAAQKINAADSLYRWQWQAGRIFKATGEKARAIASYESAIATLQTIRSDILAANKELQLNFRDSVEPVYRELMALILDSSQSTVNLQKTIDILELLKLAELQNFFGDDCVEVAKENAKNNGDLADANAAVIYSVILPSRTVMILRSPQGNLQGYPVSFQADKLQQEIDRLRLLLENRATDEYLAQAQAIYDLLMRPMEKDIAQLGVKTLVFIQDGVLRKVPMSALHDGKEFLVQKYAIATTPSISLTASKSVDTRNLKALAVGLTVERAPFPPLTNVAAEVADVQKIVGGVKLLDQDFTLANLEKQLRQNSFPIVHMATHGKFGVDNETTFLLGYDTKISLDKLDNLLRTISQNSAQRENQQAVELLTLSACQTAAGDNRAALGIAGVAVRAGVKSSLASLWFVNDESTAQLIEEFYTQWRQPNMTKAEALQKAQLKLIASEEYNHPAAWSPFILIGNWL